MSQLPKAQGTKIVEFQIEKALPSWNMFYSGTHFSRRQEAVRLWETLTQVAIRTRYRRTPVITDFPVSLTVLVEKPLHTLDCSNVCVKLVEDALKNFIIPDDSPKYISSIHVWSRRGPKEITCVRLAPEYPNPHGSQETGFGHGVGEQSPDRESREESGRGSGQERPDHGPGNPQDPAVPAVRTTEGDGEVRR